MNSNVEKDFPEFETDDILENQDLKPYRRSFGTFAQRSTLHGVRYLSDDPNVRPRLDGRSDRLDKIFWAAALLVSLVCFVWLFTRVAMRGTIVVGTSESPQPIWNIPFPAITICPESKGNGAIFNFTQTYHNILAANGSMAGMDSKQIRQMESMLLLCDGHMAEKINSSAKIAFSALMDDLKELAPSLEDSTISCKLRSKVPTSCDQVFSEVWTEDGLCFTSNSLNSEELYTDQVTADELSIKHSRSAQIHWQPEKGYTVHPTEPAYPERAHSAGTSGGLVVVLTESQKNMDFLCRGPNQGYKVVLHSPHESPLVSRHFIRATLNQDTKITIKPDVTEASEDLRSLSPKTRRCYFEGEKPLKFFKHYSQRNCEIECMSDYFVKSCGCTRFSMPRNSSTAVCGAASIKCLQTAAEEHLDDNQMDGLLTDGSNTCNCFPSCANVDYDLDVSHSTLVWKEVFEAHKTPLVEVQGMHMSRLTFVIKHNQFTATKRYQLFGTTDAIALAGGLLSLFFGASLLSLLEVVYEFGVRKIYSLKRTLH